jgi:PKD repeat protein
VKTNVERPAAVSRRGGVLALTRSATYLLPLLILLACQDESTAPESAAAPIDQPVFAVTDNVVATLSVTPDSQMVFAGDKFKLTAKPKNAAGQLLTKVVRWNVGTATIAKALDSLKATVPFRALKAGTTSITATVDTKSKAAKVVVRSTTGATVVVTPATATVATGGTVQFVATGFTAAHEKATVNVTWKATGGTVSTARLFKAGTVQGTYQVIATSLFGKADTSSVTISSGTTPPPVDRVVLLPDVAASRPGSTIKFAATLYNSSGSVVSQAATLTYQSTCGSITSNGVYTAPSSATRCSVIASGSDKADTTEVVPLADQGIPFGIFGLWPTATTIQSSGVAPFTASHDQVPPSGVASQIATAKALGIHLVFAMTGGSHENYKTNGVFDLSKWQARMQTYNTPAIRAAIAQGVADGTIIGNSVMDEPQQAGDATRSKAWGPVGTMTRERVDGLCAYVKQMFPTMPVGVFGDPAQFEPTKSYKVCEFFMAQYGYRKYNGNVGRWRDEMLGYANRDGMSVIFSINILNGGQQDKDAVYDCAGSSLMGGLGTYKPNCAMTPQEIRDFGKPLAAAGCALMSWTYQASFLTKPENQAASADVAIAASRVPRKPCTANRGPNTPPVAAFTSSCTDLTCDFTDGSSDPDGAVATYSWTFGDGATSTSQNPSHTYGTAGQYQVKLVVTDNRGGTDNVTHTVNVPAPANNPPTAAFSSSCTDLTCTFTDASTDDHGVSSYAWDFGDNAGTSTQQSPSYTYKAAGTFTVKLTVTDAKGLTGVVTHTVTVTANGTPTAEFTSLCTDLGCSFTNKSTDDGPLTSLTYAWDFGDTPAGTSTATNPSYTYKAAGTYHVKLTVTDGKGTTGSITHDVTVTAPNGTPTAEFSSTCTDLTCSFTDKSTDDGALTWAWDFGDTKGTSTQRSPGYTYQTAGTFTVKLTVTDAQGLTGVVTHTVTVTANQPPVAAFSSSCTDLGCTFTDASTDDHGVSSYAWDFGDHAGTSTAQSPSYAYQAAGTFTVKLTVTDARGLTGVITHDVTVTAPPPVNQSPKAAFTFSCTDLACSFTNTSTDDAPLESLSYAWNFGDGDTPGTSTVTNPSYTYSSAGAFTVTLIVTDGGNKTDTQTQQVTVPVSPTSVGAP